MAAMDTVLFAETGSTWLLVTVAVFVIVPDKVADGFTTRVSVALPPTERVPTLAVTVPDTCVAVPWDEVAETSVTPEGRGLVSVTPAAFAEPLFVSVMV